MANYRCVSSAILKTCRVAPMTQTNDSLECVICNDLLVDPRPLPCGHSYCGPPRSCLSSMANDTGGLCCAVCRKEYALKPADINPLYGIRDFFRPGPSSKDPTNALHLRCSAHQIKNCTLWCCKCALMICGSCFESEHDGHSVRSLKRYLQEQIQCKFGESLFDGASTYLSQLDSFLQSNSSIIDHLRNELSSIEADSLLAHQHKIIVSDFLKLSRIETQNDENEVALLLALWKMYSLDLDTFPATEQSEEVHCFSRSGSFAQSSPVQTEVPVVAKSAQKEEPDFVPSSANSAFVSPEGKTGPKTESKSVSKCNCGFSHQPNALSKTPIFLMSSLHIYERNPLRLRSSDALIICPYKFRLVPELVTPKHTSRNSKMLRILVNCVHAFDRKLSLPPFTFKYGFWLHNKGGRGHKTQSGTWRYPQSKVLVWDCILHSELVDPKKSWIYDNDCVDISIRFLQ